MIHILNDIEDWLVEHKSEVIVINFGNIGFKDSTIPVLGKIVNEQFFIILSLL